MGSWFKNLFSISNSRFHRMKWFFAYNEDHVGDYEKLLKVAVVTAKNKTYLKPYCIYDGNISETTIWLENNGVEIIRHKSYLHDDIIRVFGEDGARIGRGAFLRVDIPKILKAKAISVIFKP